MQTFGRKWTHCNLGCRRPFCRKSSRHETDDVHILCYLHRFSEIQKDSQRSRAHCLHGPGGGCLFMTDLTCSKVDRLENPQPPEYQFGVIRMPAPIVCFHFNSSLTLLLTLCSPLSQQELDLRCDSRDSRNIFSLLQVLRINQALQQSISGLKEHKRSANVFTSLCAMSAILTSKCDTNDTSCIWSFPFQQVLLYPEKGRGMSLVYHKLSFDFPFATWDASLCITQQQDASRRILEDIYSILLTFPRKKLLEMLQLSQGEVNKRGRCALPAYVTLIPQFISLPIRELPT